MEGWRNAERDKRTQALLGGDAWNRPPGRRTKQETAITSGNERVNDYTGREDGRYAWSNVRTAAAYHRWNAYHWLKQYSHKEQQQLQRGGWRGDAQKKWKRQRAVPQLRAWCNEFTNSGTKKETGSAAAQQEWVPWMLFRWRQR